MLLSGNVAGVKDGKIWLSVPISPTELEKIQAICKSEVTVEFEDGREITLAQRRKCYVLINCIAEWAGYTPTEAMKELLKYRFMTTGEYDSLSETFSLSNAPRRSVSNFISWLIEFCLTNDIPCGEPFWKLCDNIPKYVYACLINKRCAVCGKKGELHHYDSVGSGRNRKEICHVGMRALPLCRTHHTEIHNVGRDSFCKRYILEPMVIDERIADVYKLRKRGQK